MRVQHGSTCANDCLQAAKAAVSEGNLQIAHVGCAVQMHAYDMMSSPASAASK